MAVCAPSKGGSVASTVPRGAAGGGRGSRRSQFGGARDEPELLRTTCSRRRLAAPWGACALGGRDHETYLTVGPRLAPVFDEYSTAGLFGAESGWANRRLFSVFAARRPPRRGARSQARLKTLEAAGDASAVPWRRAPHLDLGFDGGQAVPGRDAYQQRDGRQPPPVRWGATTWPARHYDRNVDAVRAAFEPSRWARSLPCSTRARATSTHSCPARRGAAPQRMLIGRPCRRPLPTRLLPLEPCNVHVDRQPRRLGVCQPRRLHQAAGAVEKASSVRTVDVAAPTAATTNYRCKVSNHCGVVRCDSTMDRRCLSDGSISATVIGLVRPM